MAPRIPAHIRRNRARAVSVETGVEIQWPFETLDGQVLEDIDAVIAYFRALERRVKLLKHEYDRVRMQIGLAAQQQTGGPPIPWLHDCPLGELVVTWGLTYRAVRQGRDLEFAHLQEVLGERFQDLFFVDARVRRLRLQAFLQESHVEGSPLHQAQVLLRQLGLIQVTGRPRIKLTKKVEKP